MMLIVRQNCLIELISWSGLLLKQLFGIINLITHASVYAMIIFACHCMDFLTNAMYGQFLRA